MVLCFETETPCVAQAGLEFVILLLYLLNAGIREIFYHCLSYSGLFVYLDYFKVSSHYDSSGQTLNFLYIKMALDSPSSCPRNAGIINMCYHTQPILIFRRTILTLCQPPSFPSQYLNPFALPHHCLYLSFQITGAASY